MLLPCVLAEDGKVCPAFFPSNWVFKIGGSRFHGRNVGFIWKQMEHVVSSGRVCALTVCLKGPTVGGAAGALLRPRPPQQRREEGGSFIRLGNPIIPLVTAVQFNPPYLTSLTIQTHWKWKVVESGSRTNLKIRSVFCLKCVDLSRWITKKPRKSFYVLGFFFLYKNNILYLAFCNIPVPFQDRKKCRNQFPICSFFFSNLMKLRFKTICSLL